MYKNKGKKLNREFIYLLTSAISISTQTRGKSIFEFSVCKSRLVLQPGSVVTGTIDYRVRTDLTSRDRRFLGNRVSGSPGRIYCSHRNWIALSLSSFPLAHFSVDTRVLKIFTTSPILLYPQR